MIEQRGDAYYVTGPMTIATSATVLVEGRKLFGQQGGMIDFSGVTELDSSAVSVLMQWQREAHKQGSRLGCRNIPDNLKNLAALYGVADMLTLK